MLADTTSQLDFLKPKNFYWVLVAQAASILPLLLQLPFWVSGLWLFSVVWRIQIQRQRWPFPRNIVKFFLGALCVGGVILSYSGIAGVEAMVGLLVCSFVLKLVEMRTAKDALIILFIGFIAVAAQFLFAQSILAAAVAVASCIVLLTAWQAALTTRSKTIKQQLVAGALLLAQGLPFMVLLFVFLPRLGPLWSVPFPQAQGQTGFSDSLTLGDIGELVQSRETAFRAAFESGSPASNDLYWRGLLLEHFDGRTWHPSHKRTRSRNYEIVREGLPEGGMWEYSIILEPHYERWLFSLGVPVRVDSANMTVDLLPGRLMSADKPVSQKTQYRVAAVNPNRVQFKPMTQDARDSLLALPQGSNPRTHDLAKQWREQGLDASAIVERALAMYSDSFHYTLQPPLLADQAIDDFLFGTQKGFCEHFASSFVFLMRAADIPARVVLGYQGGSFNELERYWRVQQSDAHAWAEIWLHGAWQSVDPTAAVAPSRIRRGVADALPENDRQLLNSNPWEASWLSQVYQQLDALGYSWNRWVLNYSDETQRSLMNRLLGGYDPLRVGLTFLGLCVALFVLFWGAPRLKQLIKRSSRYEDRLIGRLQSVLAKRGYHRRKEESFSYFLVRVGRDNPDWSADLHRLAQTYEAHVYGNRDMTSELRVCEDTFFKRRRPPAGLPRLLNAK